MTDKLDAATIRELLAKITQGPWQVVRSDFYDDGNKFIVWGPEGVGHGTICRTFRDGLIASETETRRCETNAEFIALSPAIARYALELSDKVGELRAKHHEYDMNLSLAAQREAQARGEANELRTQRDELFAQLQSQAAELERLRDIEHLYKCKAQACSSNAHIRRHFKRP